MHSKLRTFTTIIIILSSVSVLTPALAASSHDYGHWGEYGIKAKINNTWSFNSDIQLRFRDNASDLHFFRWEFGPKIKFNRHFSVLVMYRLNPQEKNGEWDNQHYLLIDPVLKLYSSPQWTFDLRSRFHVRLGKLGRGFWRPRPQLSHKFKLGNHKSSWFVNNEFFIQMTELGARERINQNRLSSGFKFSLNKSLDLSAYYLLRSDKVAPAQTWNHIHIIGTALYFKF